MTGLCDCKLVKPSPHFHYDIVELKDVVINLSTVTQNRCPNQSRQDINIPHLELEIEVRLRTGARCSVKRTFADLQLLDYHLHECAFGRSFSHLRNLSDLKGREDLDLALLNDDLREYTNRLSVLISDRVTCCTLFEFLELESHGLRKQSKTDQNRAEEELNVPALTAARCVQAHVATDSDELSLQLADIVAVIDMPDASESIWWKGKSVSTTGCFKVGYFPYYCVELFAARSLPSLPILNETSNQLHSPPPTLAVNANNNSHLASISVQDKEPGALRAKKSVLLKRGKLGALLRAFFASRPSRTALKQRGLLRDRVFGCDLSEYLLRLGRATPPILELCGGLIESEGVLAGIYRLSGPQSIVQRLRARFDDDQYLLTKLAEVAKENEQQAAIDVSSSQLQEQAKADTTTVDTPEHAKLDEPFPLLQVGMDVSATSILRPLDEHQRATRTSRSSESDSNTNVLNGADQPSSNDQQKVQAQSHSVAGEREVGIDVPTGDNPLPAAPATQGSNSFRAPWYEDVYSLAAVLRMYFRELPNPLFTFELYDEMLALLAPITSLRTSSADEFTQTGSGFADLLERARQALAKLPRTHYRTARALFTHLQRMAKLETCTNMGARNLAIVWSPNLLYRRSLATRYSPQDGGSGATNSTSSPSKSLKGERAVDPMHSAYDALSEARDLTAVTEFFIRHSHLVFDDDLPVSAPAPISISLNCSTEADRSIDVSQLEHDSSGDRSRNLSVSASTAPTCRPRRPALLELADAIRVQYPDAAARDRLLEERFDALLTKYGKCETEAISRPAIGEASESADVGESAAETSTRGSSMHISLPAMRQNDFDKELAALERDLHERGRRIEDMIATRRRAGVHSAGSFLKSLFAGSSGKHRETYRRDEPDGQPDRGKENKLRKVESSRKVDTTPITLRTHSSSVRSRSSRASIALGSSVASSSTSYPGISAHSRSSRLTHSDRERRGRDRIAPAVTTVQGTPSLKGLSMSTRSSHSHTDVRAPPALIPVAYPRPKARAPDPGLMSHVSQWFAPPEYVNLPLARPTSLAFESTARRNATSSIVHEELIEFDREPSIRRSVAAAPTAYRRATTAGFPLGASSNWASSPSVPEYAVVMAPHCELEMSPSESQSSVGELNDLGASALAARFSKSTENLGTPTDVNTSEHLYVNVDVLCRSAPVTLQRTAIAVASSIDLASTRNDLSSTDNSDSELEIPASVKRMEKRNSDNRKTSVPRDSAPPAEATVTLVSAMQPMSLAVNTAVAPAPVDCVPVTESPFATRLVQMPSPVGNVDCVDGSVSGNDNSRACYDAQALKKRETQLHQQEASDAGNNPSLVVPVPAYSSEQANVSAGNQSAEIPDTDACRGRLTADTVEIDAKQLSSDVQSVHARLVKVKPAARAQKNDATVVKEGDCTQLQPSSVSRLSTMFDRRDLPSSVPAKDPVSSCANPAAIAVNEQAPVDPAVHVSTVASSGGDVGKQEQGASLRASVPVDIRMRIATFESLAGPTSVTTRSRDSMSLRARDTAV